MTGFGKHFTSMYTGSMMGAGSHVFAVWGYCVANANGYEHTVELNSKLLAFIIGDTQERIEQAITYLCAPDSDSRTKSEDGRRLLKLGEYLYRVVNHRKYREMTSDDPKAVDAKNRQRKHRDDEKQREHL